MVHAAGCRVGGRGQGSLGEGAGARGPEGQRTRRQVAEGRGQMSHLEVVYDLLPYCAQSNGIENVPQHAMWVRLRSCVGSTKRSSGRCGQQAGGGEGDWLGGNLYRGAPSGSCGGLAGCSFSSSPLGPFQFRLVRVQTLGVGIRCNCLRLGLGVGRGASRRCRLAAAFVSSAASRLTTSLERDLLVPPMLDLERSVAHGPLCTLRRMTGSETANLSGQPLNWNQSMPTKRAARCLHADP